MTTLVCDDMVDSDDMVCLDDSDDMVCLDSDDWFFWLHDMVCVAASDMVCLADSDDIGLCGLLGCQ